MRNRNLIYNKIEILQSILINLRRIVNTQEPIESYKVQIGKAEALVEEIRDIVESQPFSPTELNRR
jgi:hypothetical protein|tara:strand:- start:264 stop:461 length:198 start_codon:yes stop_codon:yes gene_type:complete